MDLFDRQIVGYSTGTSPSLELTNSSLRAAIATPRQRAAPAGASDQGFRYQHRSWRDLLARVHAAQSMSRQGNCHDKAVVENFFGHLVEECLQHVRHLSIEVLENAIHDYIAWFNTERTSETLKGLSPVQYRAQALAA